MIRIDNKFDKRVFYVSNISLNQAYLDWYANIKIAEEEGIEEPPIPDEISIAMMKIATRLSYKPNFINYTYREEMIGDALCDLVKYAKKFNPAKSSNPFSYITTIAFNAFLRRIAKEKDQTKVKASIIMNADMSEFLSQADTDNSEYKNSYIEFLREFGANDLIAHPTKIKPVDNVTSPFDLI